ncbi:MAG: glycosyltransferase [Bosea sp.]|uniref:glycosyltransferase n=1 Tax=Bosea sp. (in: a-proteobacteria) TaxID=1871050 RepID=UPI001AC56409|nr:glycosyltransferase [Bosea sp. (in: a-proteobacteria)]MBN9452561.1 glycosyltransferase [Bosea sp. (in: a-proteobacteria)]
MTQQPSSEHSGAADASLVVEPKARTQRVCIISLTSVVQEPRVLRQISAFLEKGWLVTVVGYSHGKQPPDTWDFIEADLKLLPDRSGRVRPPETRRIRQMVLSDPLAAARRISEILVAHARRAVPKLRVRLPLASPIDRPWSWREARKHFYRDKATRNLKRYLIAKVPPCDLVIAHDYFTYILADDVAKRRGARLGLDCHEYALQQYDYAKNPDHDARNYWLTVTRPYVDALQRHCFNSANVVSTVCDGIADLLTADYKLAQRPVVVRSTPFYERMPFRPCGETIEIVYHGLITPTRNLDIAVRALVLCREEFQLTMRGPADPNYDRELLDLAKQLGVAHRFTIAPPVPFADLVASANQADIGYFAFDVFSNQRKYTLPNKFFEYIMSGLALVVMDVPELSKIIRKHKNGKLVAEFDAETIANSINSLTRCDIEEMKRNSLKAAESLCWEVEQKVFLEGYRIS